MNIKKIILSLIFIASFGYFLYDISLKASTFLIDYFANKDIANLSDTLYLHSENGILRFERVNKNKYCLNQSCGYIKNLTQNKFDFHWEKYDVLKFKQSNEEKNVFLLDNNKSSKDKNLPPLKISFKINESGETKQLACYIDKCIYKDNSIAPFQFVIAGQKVLKDTPFEQTGNIKQISSIVLKNNNGSLNFFQKKEDVFVQTKNAHKNNNFLFIISSYKRPVYLSGLIHRLNFQTYPIQNFDISVSLKGMHSDILSHMLGSDFKDLLQNKRLFIRTDENKNQFSNMLDTIRNLNLEKYDYICKIDDDDWYHKDYLFNLNALFNAIGNPDFITAGTLFSLEKDTYDIYLKTRAAGRTGPSICFSKSFAKELLQIEKMTNEEIKPLLKKDANLSKEIKNTYEDMILNAYAQEQDKKFLYYSLFPLFIYNRTTQSIMRPTTHQ